MSLPEVHVRCPAWTEELAATGDVFETLESRLRLALAAARRNIEEDSGGPFGAAVFEAETGRLVALGVNLVLPLSNSVLHAEMVAFMMAQQVLGSHTLALPGGPVHELYSSCEPCAMCLGAVHWSGVRRVVFSATRQDAHAIDFDEGPVFPASYDYLRHRGIDFVPGLLREEGRAVLEYYARRGGTIYNG
jgi:tRNA(Arg) A34 adenosine deaminase TadA